MILEARKKAVEEQDGTGLKILTPKQMLQRLPITLAQVKAKRYKSKKVYNNIIKSIQ